MKSKTDIAFELFNGGFDCAQAVVGPFCASEDGAGQLALKLASGYGGGTLR